MLTGRFQIVFRRWFNRVMRRFGFTWADFRLVIRMFNKNFWIQQFHFFRFMFSYRLINAVKSRSGAYRLRWAAGQCRTFTHILNLAGRIIQKFAPQVGTPIALGSRFLGYGCRIIGQLHVWKRRFEAVRGILAKFGIRF
jgi:hypothetical protein